MMGSLFQELNTPRDQLILVIGCQTVLSLIKSLQWLEKKHQVSFFILIVLILIKVFFVSFVQLKVQEKVLVKKWFQIFLKNSLLRQRNYFKKLLGGISL